MTDQIATPSPETLGQLRREMFQQLQGCYISASVSVAAQLAIADHVAALPQTVDELAQATGTNARTLYRLLRALTSVGIFHETDDGRFHPNPKSELLRSDVPGSMHAVACMMASPLQWPALGNLHYTIRTGRPAFDDVFGVKLWEYLAKDQAAHDLFQYVMTSFSTAEIGPIIDAYDFCTASRIVDIAGGQGRLLAAVLKQHPQAEGVLFELPEVVDEARKLLHAHGVADRCTVVGGDMFCGVPAGGDIYLMKNVIHDWDDNDAVRLLRSCSQAMDGHARLVLITRIVRPGNEPDPSKFQDLNLLVHLGGAERTEAELDSLLLAAGLRIQQIIETRSPLSIIECVVTDPSNGPASSG